MKNDKGAGPAKDSSKSETSGKGSGQGTAPSSPGQNSSLPSAIRWFVSKTVRQASAMRKHVHRLLCSQIDILSPQAASGINQSIQEMDVALKSGASTDALKTQMDKLEESANKWLRPYPNHSVRENVEVFLVAIAVAMGIRTFFVQPFKIPTGSMQPTLFGVTSENLIDRPDYKIPTGIERVREWFEGISYVDIKAKTDGVIEKVGAPVGIRIFDFWQQIVIGGQNHTILFPPDFGQSSRQSRTALEERAELDSSHEYKKGEPVVRMKVQAGDHLFVDRLTYNFRKPTRGEIIVFQTLGIQRLPQDQFYIKRLVALGGEKVQIGDDRHLVINGKRLDAATPHFENVYSFDPNEPPRESHYSGHVNGAMGISFAPYFPTADTIHAVEPNHYMVMGDNTMNSFDSRGWGEFSSDNVIGKSFFVYWPITSRFGWGNR